MERRFVQLLNCQRWGNDLSSQRPPGLWYIGKVYASLGAKEWKQYSQFIHVCKNRMKKLRPIALLKPLKQGVEDIDVLDFMCLGLFLELLFSYQRWLQPSRSRQEWSYLQGQAATWAHSPSTMPEQPARSLVRTDTSGPIPGSESRGRPTKGSSGVTWQAQLGLRCHWNCPNFGNVIQRPPTLQRSSPTACQAVLARQQPAGWGMRVCPNTTSRYKALNRINITETSATAFSIVSESRLWCCWSCRVPQTVKQNHTGNIMLKVYSRSHYKICRIVNC